MSKTSSKTSESRPREAIQDASSENRSIDEIAAHFGVNTWMHCLTRTGQAVHGASDCDLEDGNSSRPRFFTDFESLHAHATSIGQVAHDRSYETRSELWLTGLMRMYSEGARGFMLDAGSDGTIELNRDDIRALIMALTVEWFVSPSDLCVVMLENRVYYHVNSAGQKFAFAFTTRGSAHENLERMRERVPGLVVAPVDQALLLEGTVGAGVARLILDPGMPGERSFSRENLETLREFRLGCDPQNRTAATAASFAQAEREPSAAMPGPEASQPDELAPTPPDPAPPVRVQAASEEEEQGFFDAIVPSDEEIEASAAPTLHMAGPVDEGFEPRMSPEEARTRLLELKRFSESDSQQSWWVTERLINNFDWWVPIARQSTTDRPWPSAQKAIDANGREVMRISIFSSDEEGKRSSAHSPEAHDLVPLAGLEAFRWIWSAPDQIVEITIDPDGAGGGLSLHRNSIPAMLFPTILGVKDLALVPEVHLAELARLDGVHGLKPEVIRALATEWGALLSPPMDGKLSPIRVGVAEFLAVFSDAEHHRDFVRFSDQKVGTRVVQPATPPFMDWLRLTSRCDGVVLNPSPDKACTNAVLTFDAVELFHLQLWSEEMRAPDGTQVVSALAALQHGDYAADQAVCGRIAADWPLYFAGALKDGENSRLIEVPGTGDLAIFTGEREFAEFKRSYRTQGASIESAEPHYRLPRWRSSLFTLANDKYSGLCINPGSSTAPEGVRLDGKGLDGAIARLEERLRPRVRGFPTVS